MKRIAITGAAGYLGQLLLRRLRHDADVERVLALDLRPVPSDDPRVVALRHDVTEPMDDLFREHAVDTAVHMAYIINPTHDRLRERRVNIGGTENFYAAAAAAAVDKTMIASSAPAYGE